MFTYICTYTQGCLQLGKALDMPPTAILSGLLLLVSYCSSDCIVEIPDTQWVEPVLVWITISMPSGSGKTPVYISCKFVRES